MGKVRHLRPANRHIRSSKELRDLINFIRAKCIMAGKKPPTMARITRKIVMRIKKEDLLKDFLGDEVIMLK
jgi:hypothetical protein